MRKFTIACAVECGEAVKVPHFGRGTITAPDMVEAFLQLLDDVSASAAAVGKPMPHVIRSISIIEVYE